MPSVMSGTSRVAEVAPADSDEALRHFERLLAFETDCWDVQDAMKHGTVDFVLLDVRGPQSFRAGHVPGATNLPHGKINERNLSAFPANTLFVVYCDGPHCNGADRAAVKLARLGRKVKKMIGGIEGWKDDGFDLATSPEAPRAETDNSIQTAATPREQRTLANTVR